MSDISIEDNEIYSIFFDNNSNTIHLFTEYIENESSEYTDIVFENVILSDWGKGLFTYINRKLEGFNVLSKVWERDFNYFSESNSQVLKFIEDSSSESIESLKERNYKLFEVETHYGILGWVIAKSLKYKSREFKLQIND